MPFARDGREEVDCGSDAETPPELGAWGTGSTPSKGQGIGFGDIGARGAGPGAEPQLTLAQGQPLARTNLKSAATREEEAPVGGAASEQHGKKAEGRRM